MNGVNCTQNTVVYNVIPFLRSFGWYARCVPFFFTEEVIGVASP